MTEDHALMHPSRQIGRLGTAARIALGGVLLAVPFVVGDAPGWLDAALGILALPAAVLSFLWLRARRKPQRLAATGFGGYTINFGIGAVLLAVPFTREAAFFFYGASMLLAAMQAASSSPSQTGCCGARTRSGARSSARSTPSSAKEPAEETSDAGRRRSPMSYEEIPITEELNVRVQRAMGVTPRPHETLGEFWSRTLQRREGRDGPKTSSQPTALLTP